MNKQLSRFKHSEGLIMLKAKVIITFIITSVIFIICSKSQSLRLTILHINVHLKLAEATEAPVNVWWSETGAAGHEM